MSSIDQDIATLKATVATLQAASASQTMLVATLQEASVNQTKLIAQLIAEVKLTKIAFDARAGAA